MDGMDPLLYDASVTSSFGKEIQVLTSFICYSILVLS
jgi:hypothetical protein